MNAEITSNLYRAIQRTSQANLKLPFSIFSSYKLQSLLNVPITKPVLIVVLGGVKELGADHGLVCHAGDFVFLSNSPAINMRNIPTDEMYYALLIEFDQKDIDGLYVNSDNKHDYLIGKTCQTLETCLTQFIESSAWASEEIISLRKREIILLLKELGHQQVLSLLGGSKLKDQVHTLFIQQGFSQLSVEDICENLAMSESTLRRKLKAEGSSVQDIKVQARLGLALHLLQTTTQSIGIIAEQCGYQSQSRFTDGFKQRFGLTPSELRKTKMTD